MTLVVSDAESDKRLTDCDKIGCKMSDSYMIGEDKIR